MPSGPLTDSIRASAFYNKTATELLTPVAGDVLTRGPVFTKAVESEFRRVLQRKYEVIDSAVPANIEQAAVKITKNADQTRKRRGRFMIGSGHVLHTIGIRRVIMRNMVFGKNRLQLKLLIPIRASV